MADGSDVDAQATVGAMPTGGAIPPGHSEQAPTGGAMPPGGEGEGERLAAALKAERDARRQAEKALKDLQKQQSDGLSESERLAQRVAELEQAKAQSEQDALRMRIATETGLPIAFAARLRGTDENSLREDAEALKTLIPAQPTVTTSNKSVGGPQGPPSGSRSPEEWQAFLRKR